LNAEPFNPGQLTAVRKRASFVIMPSGDTVEEDVSPEERIALAEAKAAKRAVEIFGSSPFLRYSFSSSACAPPCMPADRPASQKHFSQNQFPPPASPEFRQDRPKL
jgi:hypothetical protein